MEALTHTLLPFWPAIALFGGVLGAMAPVACAGDSVNLVLELRIINQSQTCIGNKRFKVEAAGDLYVALNQQGCDAGSLWSAQYSATPTAHLSARQLGALRDAVVSGEVMDLPAQLTDADRVMEDGYREELDLTLDGKARSVVVAGGRSEPVERVRRLLESYARRGS